MSVARNLAVGAITATLLATSTAAVARPWGPGWGYRGHGRYYRHHHGGDVAGALIGGLVIGGAVAALASAAEDASSERVYADTAPPPPLPPEADRPLSGPISSQGEAVDACSAIAEEEGHGPVNDITRAARWQDGWQVEGVIDRGTTGADGYRALDRFSCSVRYGAVEDFRLDGAPVAWRD